MATSAVSSTTSASTAATTSTSSTSSTTSATSAQAASKAAAQKIVTSLSAGSGVDVNSLAQNLVDAERIPRQTAIQNKIDKNNARVSGLSAMMYMLSDLKSKLSALKDKSSLSSMTATSSSTAVSATAVAGAVVGSHDIQVNRLASAQRMISAGFASDSTSINNGSPFQISISKPGVTTGTAGSSSSVNGQLMSISGVNPNGFSDYKSFSVKVDGTLLTVTPQVGLSTPAAVAADLQTQLQALTGGATVTVSVDPTVPDQLNIDAGVGHTATAGAFTAGDYPLHLDGISFGSPTPASTDFTDFSLTVGGQNYAFSLGANATPTDLAQDIQAQLQAADNGSANLSVTAVVDSMGNFSLNFQDAANRTMSSPALTVDPTATGVMAGTVHTRAQTGAEIVASVTGISLGGGSGYSSFSVSVDGVAYSVVPARGLTSLGDLAADIQSKLRAAAPSVSGVSDISVTVDATNPNQLNITSTSGHAYADAQLSAPVGNAHLDGVKFGTTAAVDDFKSFSVVVDGVTRTVTPAPTAATSTALAADLQTKIQALMGNTDVTVDAVDTASGFSLYLKSASNKTITNPTLKTNVVDMTPPVGLSGGTGYSPAAGVKTGTSSGTTLSGVSLGTSPDSGNFKAFTVKVDGVSRTVTPTAGLTTLNAMASDLQSQLNALVGGTDIVVTATGDALSVSSTSGRTLSGPMLSGTTLDAVSFATNNPSTKDFRGFGLTVEGTNFTIIPSPNATTLDALAADLQSQLRNQDGKNDLSVTVFNGQLQFWSASNRAVSNPVLLPNTYELTPAGVARAINDKKLGVTAQVVNTGSASNPYKLVISGTTGAKQAFDISSTASVGNLLGFTSLSTAADADIVVDGVAMTRSTNTVSDAITGVTLNLKGTTTSGGVTTSANLDIGLDTTSFKTKMTDMVSSFNDTWDLLNQVSDPKSTLATYGATLVGDSVVRTVRQQIRAMFQGNSSTPGTTVSSFWQMGIKIDEKGVMAFDSATFDTTVQGNYADTVKSLTGNFDNLSTYSTAPAGFAGDAVRKLTKLLDTASNGGPILSASENANTQNTKYQEDLTKLQTRMDALLVRYQKQLASMDSLVGSTNTQKTSLKSTFDGMMSVYTKN